METEVHLHIVGLGLIGGSIASGLQSIKSYRITGWDRDRKTNRRALDRELIEAIHPPGELPESTDVLLLAVPVPAMREIVQRCLENGVCPPVITDVGSTKEYICRTLDQMLSDRAVFVGAHPMAGSEESGLRAADPLLFENALCVITPLEAPDERVGVVEEIWNDLGAHILRMDPEQHDQAAAYISHLPHLSAAALLHCMTHVDDYESNALPLAAGGFRDTTRIAEGNPDLWRDIFETNQQQILASIRDFRDGLRRIESLVENQEWDEVTRWLQGARDIRRRIPAKAKGLVGSLHELRLQAPDRPGVLATITGILGDASINITDIEVLRVREGEMGTVRLAFREPEEYERARELLSRKGEGIRII